MDCTCDIVAETGLQFYGKMSASMSHEIKNALSIIQEHAGLLDDFTVMAEQGVPMDAQRVKALAGKIQGQIERANGIARGMNRLAHYMDEWEKTLDLAEVLSLLVELSHRLASVRGVLLEAKDPATKVSIRTSPFFLQNLVWLCLAFAMDVTGEGKRVSLSAEKTEAGATIRFGGLQGLADVPVGRFPEDRAKALLGILNAEVAIDTRAKEIVLALPQDIGR